MSRASWSVAAGRLLVVGCLAVVAGCRLDSRADSLGDDKPHRFGLGHTPSAATLAAEDISILPDGTGLPAGSGTPAEGAAIYASSCASCHGANGEGISPYPQLIGGPKGRFDFATDYKIPRTIGNYWPYAPTLFDYIRRAMPLTAPGSLSADQTYAVSAYLLNREGLVPDGTRLDAKGLAAIQMPARKHFVMDDRRAGSGGRRVR